MIMHGVGEALRLLDVVRGHEDRRALGAQRVDERPELLPHLRVEADGRLVEQDEPGPVDERPRDQQAPAHAARELVDPGVAPVARFAISSARSIASRRSARGTR